MFQEAEKAAVFEEVRARVNSDPRITGLPISATCLFQGVFTVQAIRKRGARAVIQAGTCEWPRIRPDQDDGVIPTHFGYVWSPTETPSVALLLEGRMPEVHVWAGIPRTGEIVDVTTGLFPEQAKRIGEFDWPGDLPPKYLWGKPPERVIYEPEEEAIRFVLDAVSNVYGMRTSLRLVR